MVSIYHCSPSLKSHHQRIYVNPFIKESMCTSITLQSHSWKQQRRNNSDIVVRGWKGQKDKIKRREGLRININIFGSSPLFQGLRGFFFSRKSLYFIIDLIIIDFGPRSTTYRCPGYFHPWLGSSIGLAHQVTATSSNSDANSIEDWPFCFCYRPKSW